MLFRRLVIIAIVSAFTYAFAGSPATTVHSVAPERPEALVGPQNGIWDTGPDLETGVPEAIYQGRLAEEARVEAERVAAEAEAARIAAAKLIHIGTPSLVNAGPHSDAWWGGVAQCEQGGRNDPYFGYFSWMDGSAAGLTWDQQVAKSNDLLARAGREIGPWAASCVAAGYRASPGG